MRDGTDDDLSVLPVEDEEVKNSFGWAAYGQLSDSELDRQLRQLIGEEELDQLSAADRARTLVNHLGQEAWDAKSDQEREDQRKELQKMNTRRKQLSKLEALDLIENWWKLGFIRYKKESRLFFEESRLLGHGSAVSPP
jgi:hypothetical protein